MASMWSQVWSRVSAYAPPRLSVSDCRNYSLQLPRICLSGLNTGLFGCRRIRRCCLSAGSSSARALFVCPLRDWRDVFAVLLRCSGLSTCLAITHCASARILQALLRVRADTTFALTCRSVFRFFNRALFYQLTLYLSPSLPFNVVEVFGYHCRHLIVVVQSDY